MNSFNLACVLSVHVLARGRRPRLPRLVLDEVLVKLKKGEITNEVLEMLKTLVSQPENLTEPKSWFCFILLFSVWAICSGCMGPHSEE